MVYLQDWDEFYAAVEQLYIHSPDRTRYLLKYRHKTGKMTLKVTDDRSCLKYESDQLQDLKRLERLNKRYMGEMLTIRPEEMEYNTSISSHQPTDTVMTDATTKAQRKTSSSANSKKRNKK